MLTRREFMVLSAAGAGVLLLSHSTARALTDLVDATQPRRRPNWLRGNARTGCAQPYPFSPDSYLDNSH